jgi:hypothetical protein
LKHICRFDFKDKKIYFDIENKFSGNDYLLECLVDDFIYVPTQNQNLYFYVNYEDGVWIILNYNYF